MQKNPMSDVEAILQDARRLRAIEMHRLARAFVARVAGLFTRAAPSRSH